MKCIICTLLLLETVQTTLVTHDAYRYFVTGFGDFDQLNKALLEWLAYPVITGVGASFRLGNTCFADLPYCCTVSCISQLYYTYRLRVFAQSFVPSMTIAMVRQSCNLRQLNMLRSRH